MRILLTILVIAGVVSANNLRGEDQAPESRELQTIIYGSRSSGRSRNRRRQDLYIVEEDNYRKTVNCADDVADEFDDDFDEIFFVDDEDDANDDARNGDVVAVIDRGTRCDRVADDIDDELDDRHPTNTVYAYYGSGSKYYRNKGGKRKYGHRYKNRKNRRSRSRKRSRSDNDNDRDHHHNRKRSKGDKNDRDKDDDRDHDHGRDHERDRHNWGGGRDDDDDDDDE